MPDTEKKRIAHISDLHFGTEVETALEALRASLADQQPELVIISGDLTQRARAGQFQAARRYLDSLPYPQLVVPGNHDIPLFNLVARFGYPLRNYRRYITEDLSPVHEGQGYVVLGLNTARSFTWKNGRISHEQMRYISERICGGDDEIIRILVTHHPFLPPPDQQKGSVVGRAGKFLKMVDSCDLDLLLSGHFHQSYSGGTHEVYELLQSSALGVQAGTATSHRTKSEPNSYNMLYLSPGDIEISVRSLAERSFEETNRLRYQRDEGRWKMVEQRAEITA